MEETVNSNRIAEELLRLDAHIILLAKMLRSVAEHEPREPSVRAKYLYASVLKILRMGRAVEHVAKGAYAEEVRAMSRTMAEVVINAAYLQEAEEKELSRFEHFDTQSAYRHAERLRPLTGRTLPVSDQHKIDTVVAQARLRTGRKDSDPTWSSRNVTQRAEYTDKTTKLNLMVPLVRTAYVYGHSAVHGTYDSLAPFIAGMEDAETFSFENRQGELIIAIGSINFVLSTMGFYLNSRFSLGVENHILDAGRLTVAT